MYKQLRRDAVKGMGWALFSSVSVRVFQILTTLTLAKLLVPADFGVFSLTTIIIAAMSLIPHIGFAQVLIYQQEDVRKTANTAFILSMTSSAALSAMIFICAPNIAQLFGAPLIAMPLRLMSVGLAVYGLVTVPQALLDRELKFRLRMIPEITAAFVYAVVAVTLALLNFGVWSMVIAWTVMSIVEAAVTWKVSSWRPRLEFRKDCARVIIAYGGHLTLATLASFLFLQIDNASVGKWLGLKALGFYSIAFTTCNMPATNLTSVVNRVMFPTYSKLNGNKAEVRSFYLKTIKHLSSLTLPAVAVLMTLPEPFIRLFYGQKWEGAIPLFHILAVYGLMRSLGATSSTVFMSMGRTWMVQRVSLTQLILGAGLVYPVAMKFGVTGVAVLFTAAYFTGTAYGLIEVLRMLDIRLGEWFNSIKAPAVSAMIAGGATWLMISTTRLSWLNLGLETLIVLGGYGIVIVILDKSVFTDIRSALKKPSDQASAASNETSPEFSE